MGGGRRCEKTGVCAAAMAEKRMSRWYFGGLASCGAACCTHPLDLLKVRGLEACASVCCLCVCVCAGRGGERGATGPKQQATAVSIFSNAHQITTCLLLEAHACVQTRRCCTLVYHLCYHYNVCCVETPHSWERVRIKPQLKRGTIVIIIIIIIFQYHI